MSEKKPFSIRMQKIGTGGKVMWIEQSFATAYDLSVFYNNNTPKKKRTKRGGKKKNKNKG